MLCRSVYACLALACYRSVVARAPSVWARTKGFWWGSRPAGSDFSQQVVYRASIII